MTYGEFVRRTFTAVFILVGIVTGIIVVWNIRSFILLAFTAWVLSVALDLPITRLHRRGLAKPYAVLITVIGFIITILLLSSLIFPPLVEQTVDLVSNLPETTRDAVRTYEDVYQDSSLMQRVMPEFTLEDYDELIDPGDDNRGDQPAVMEIDIPRLLGSAVPILGGIGGFVTDLLANLLLVVFLTIYFIIDPIPYYRGIVALAPAGKELRVIEIFNEIRRIVTVWLGALMVAMTTQATLVMISLGLILQIPNALALALIAGLANIIPNLGFYLALIPVIVVTAAHDPGKLIPAIVLYVIGGEFESKLVTPQFVKAELALPAGLVLIFQLVAAAYLGFFGLLLAVPILAIIISLIRELYVVDTLGKGSLMQDVIRQRDGNLELIQLPLESDGP